MFHFHWMMNMTKCNECEKDAEFLCLLECIGNEGPQSESKNLCKDCMEKEKPSLIDSWTKAEVMAFDKYE